ncbi:MAG TPA: dolichyl-phosphate beta-glucosyltransferase [Chthoniobacteraceae bacterium]|jgi:glycosyltransferase involved in cell wall biosynthesis
MVPYLSLVLPAYNEAKRLPPTIGRLAEFVRGFTRDMEVLIVVEKSADGTLDIARELVAQQADFAPKVRIIDNVVHRGKGFAVRSGMLQACGEHIFYMDADLSVPLAEVNAFLRHFEAHPEIQVLIGNRQHPGARITLAQSWLRRSMGQTFNRIISVLGMAGTRDTQCGFKAFRRAAAHAIFERQQIDGFAFDVEVLLLAERLGLNIDDLPVEWINSPESKVRIVQDSLRMLYDAISIRRSINRRFPRGCISAEKSGTERAG